MALPDFPDYNKWGFSLVALNNDVYVTGRCWGCRCGVGVPKERGWSMGDKDVGTGRWRGAGGYPPFRAKPSPCSPLRWIWPLVRDAQGRLRSEGVAHLTCPSPGGSRGSQNDTWSTTQAWRFCPRDGAWKPIASMLRARTNHTSAVLNGEIYVIGGKATKTPRVLLGQGSVGAPEQQGGCSVPPPCRDDGVCGGGGAL